MLASTRPIPPLRAVASLVIAGLVGCARPRPPEPPTPLSLAAEANAQGEAALAEGRAAEAARHFFDAVARNPEPLYLLNLCRARFAEGDLGDARRVCAQAAQLSPNPVFEEAVRRVTSQLGESPASEEPAAPDPPAEPVKPPVPAPPREVVVERSPPRIILYCPDPEPGTGVSRITRLDCIERVVDPRSAACIRDFCTVNPEDPRCGLE